MHLASRQDKRVLIMVLCRIVQVVETGAAVTWSFFAMPAIHLDEDMPAVQVSQQLLNQ
jgi:hypothetical protein